MLSAASGINSTLSASTSRLSHEDTRGNIVRALPNVKAIWRDAQRAG
jgi:hypothetical protein